MRTLRRVLWLAALIAALVCHPALGEDNVPAARALLVGCDRFVTKPDVYPSSINNVYAMQEAFQQSLVPLEGIYLATEGVTTKDELIFQIRAAFSGSAQGDTNYLYISTHGEYDGVGEPALLLSDGVTQGRITASELQQALDPIPGTKVLLIDACNSGAFIGKGQKDFPGEVHFLGDSYRVLCSGGALEESWYWSTDDEATGRQGAFYFTQALSQALSPKYDTPADSNRDGQITLNEVYQYLLKNHATSTPQIYPQESDFVLLRYDTKEHPPASSLSPIRDIVFSDTWLDAAGDSLTIEFTALRPVRVAYQVVYYLNGAWRFDQAQMLYDNAEQFGQFGDEKGAIAAGRKVRSLTLKPQEADTSGYALVQLVSIDRGRLTVHAGRILCVSPGYGMPDVSVSTWEQYSLSQARELPVFIGHQTPCRLSVAVVDEKGQVIKRLCHLQSTRPIGTGQQGSMLYWDATDKKGQKVAPGTYYLRVSGVLSDVSYTTLSTPVVVTE